MKLPMRAAARYHSALGELHYPEARGMCRRREAAAKRGNGMSELVNGIDASIVDQKASKVGPAGIDIAYQRLGSPDAALVLLIMGIAAQSINWPDAFCHSLVESGLQVIRFDNRDSGLSTHLTDAPPPATCPRCLTRCRIWLPTRSDCWTRSAAGRPMSSARPWEASLRKPWQSSIRTVSALSPP